MTKEEAVFVLRGRRNQCKEMAEAVDIAIEALIQEPSNDTISRQTVLDIDFKRIILTTAKPSEIIVEKIKALPPVTPQSKTEHWIDCYERDPWYRCSECREKVWGSYHKYCPNCGAKMEVDK